MGPWNLNTMRFGGDWTPQSSSEKVIGSLQIERDVQSYIVFNKMFLKLTPPKTNIEPENGPLEKEIPVGNHHFQVPC